MTVLIPAFNREDFVGEAIRSVLGQSFTDLELIVIDDGSTDGTRDVVSAFTDPRLRLVARPNGGVSAAMNTGLRAGRGRYLARLGSDDVWLPDFLATQVAVLEAQRDVGLVYSRAQCIDESGTPLPDIWGKPLRYPGDPLRSMLYEDCTCDITVVVRREVIEAVGPYDESLSRSVDWDMWLRAASVCRFAFTDRVLARFRRHAGNLTHLDSDDTRFACRQRVLDKVFADPELAAGARAMRPVAYRNLHIDEAVSGLVCGRRDRALLALAQAVAIGGSPAGTLTRIAWFGILRRHLLRHSFGRQLDAWQSGVRQWVRELGSDPQAH